MRTMTIWLEDGMAMMRFPFDRSFMDWLKSTFHPSERMYDPEKRVWGVQAGRVRELIGLAGRHFDHVEVMDDLAPIASDDGSLRAALLEGLPRPVLEKVYRCIMREVHPDMGGDLEMSKRVNVAWDRLRGR